MLGLLIELQVRKWVVKVEESDDDQYPFCMLLFYMSCLAKL